MNLNDNIIRNCVCKSLATGDIDDLLSSSLSAVDFSEEEDTEFFDLDCSRVLIVLKQSSKFYFYGSLSVQCIAGRVEAFGFILKPGYSVNIYSLPGNSAIYLSSISETPDPCIEFSYILKLGFGLMQATKLYNCIKSKSVSLVILEKSHLPYKLTNQLPIRAKNCSKAERILDAQFDNENKKLRQVTMPAKVMAVPIKDSFRIVLCAGQGLGKSTILRYLINKGLNSHKRVLYIDTDIGQSEFTLPEAVSAVIIEEPLMGPSYTHFKKPILSYHLGTNNVSDCVENFLNAVKKMIDECSENEELDTIPWFINTMGFCKGIGVLLIANIISFVKPTHVIQIQGPPSKNFPSLLKPSFVSSTVANFVEQYSLLEVNAFDSNTKREGLKSNPEMRWLGIQVYFNNIKRPSYYLAIPSTAVKVINCKMKKDVDPAYYHMLSAKVVALCSWNSAEEIPRVVDYGILIGFHKESSTFIVLTPANENDDIKAICLGSLQIPSRIDKFLGSKLKGLLPHTQFGSSNANLTKPARKMFRFLFEKSF